jgi:hypothetical protein
VEFGPKQSGLLINQLGDLSFDRRACTLSLLVLSSGGRTPSNDRNSTQALGLLLLQGFPLSLFNTARARANLNDTIQNAPQSDWPLSANHHQLMHSDPVHMSRTPT